jgi:hypothetical protein
MRLRFTNKSQSTARESVEVKVRRGLVPSGVTPAALSFIKDKVGITTSTPTPPQEGGGGDSIGNQVVTWVMSNGSWNDGAVWDDRLSWQD